MNKRCIMKKNLLMTALLCFVCLVANAQKFALIDMEYILKNIPAYERANEQLNQISKKWQSEVEAVDLIGLGQNLRGIWRKVRAQGVKK